MHEHHEIMESDDNFVQGELCYIVPGNEGRVLDGRRTPGYIESYDNDSAMFVWRITDFEDEGKCWEIPAEQISSYQFRKGSKCLSENEVQSIVERCKVFQEKLTIIRSEENYNKTLAELNNKKRVAKKWLTDNSVFLKRQDKICFAERTGFEALYIDLENYMTQLGLIEIEQKTANQYLLNPYSGEWIKGLRIVMAEMGLIDYYETIPRTSDIFCGLGEKRNRKEHILSRMAFIQSLFELLDIKEVPLYRGMSSAVSFYETPCTLLSATFSSDTAKEFASIGNDDSFRSTYFVKFTYPVSNLFMTFLETKQFNERYQEQEAIIFYRDIISF